MSISNEAKLFGYIIGETLSGVSTIKGVSVRFSEQARRNVYSFQVLEGSREICSFAVFVKTSAKRLSPWRYTFLREHQEFIEQLRTTHQDVFLALVNGNDGVACFNYTTLKILLDDHFDESEWISVRRKPNEQYTVAGKDGKLSGKLPLNEFPSAIIQFVDQKCSAYQNDQINSLGKVTEKRKKLFGFL